MLKIDFDLNKSQKNINECGLSFEMAYYFDWGGALYAQDNRSLYSEDRFVAIGYLDKRLHVLCFTPISQSKLTRNKAL